MNSLSIRRSFTVVSLVLVSAGTLYLLPKPSPPAVLSASSPRLTFDHSEIDLGEVAQGQVAEGLFTFVNLGVVPVEVQDVKSDCSCSIAGYTKASIPPGGRGEVRIKVKTANRIGSAKNTFEVTYVSRGVTALHKLTSLVSIYANGKVKFLPEAIYLGSVSPGNEIEREAEVFGLPERDPGTGWEARNFECSSWVRVQEIRKVSNAHTIVKLFLKVPPMAGELAGRVMLHTGNSTFPTSEIPIYATVESPYHATPAAIIKAVSTEAVHGPFDIAIQGVDSSPTQIKSYSVDHVTGGVVDVARTSTNILSLTNIRWDDGASILRGSVEIKIVDSPRPHDIIVIVPFYFVKR